MLDLSYCCTAYDYVLCIFQLSSEEIEEFVVKHELQLSHFKEEMRAALASDPKGNFLYSLNCNVFSWKRKLSDGLVAKLGHIHVKEVSRLALL